MAGKNANELEEPHKIDGQRTTPLVSNSSQSPVPVGSRPIDRHFHRPTPRVRILQSRKTIFCNGSVNIDFGFLTVEGAN